MLKTFNVLDKQVEVVMASAEKQMQLFSEIGMHLFKAYGLKDKLDTDDLTIVVATLNFEQKKLLTDALINKATVVGTTIPVSLNDFTGRTMELYKFLAELIKWNLEDFFTFMASQKSDEPKEKVKK